MFTRLWRFYCWLMPYNRVSLVIGPPLLVLVWWPHQRPTIEVVFIVMATIYLLAALANNIWMISYCAGRDRKDRK
jgi:hypothetical protein